MKRKLHQALIILGVLNAMILTIILGLAAGSALALEHTASVVWAEWLLFNPQVSLPMLATIVVFAFSTTETLRLGEKFVDFMTKKVYRID